MSAQWPTDPRRGQWFFVRLGLLLAGVLAMMSSSTATTPAAGRRACAA